MESAVSPSSPSVKPSESLSHMQRSLRSTRTNVQRDTDSSPCSPLVALPTNSDHPMSPAEEHMLISSSSTTRASGLHILHPSQPQGAFPPQLLAIPSDQQTYTNNTGQDVRHHSLNGFQASPHTDTPSGYFGSSSSTHPESPKLSSLQPPQHGSIETQSHRPRTYHQVFHTTSDLAAHHGIPQSFPPPPRTTPRRSPESTTVDTQSEYNFPDLCANYISMLSQKSIEQTNPAPELHQTTMTAPMSLDDEAAAHAVAAALSGTDLTAPRSDSSTSSLTSPSRPASPEFFMHSNFDPSDYLTSPLESPLDDDMLTTPAIGDMSMTPDIWTSPAIMGPSGDFDEMPSLFGDATGYEEYESKPAAGRPLPLPEFDNLYQMSPETPFLDTPALQMSSLPQDGASSVRSRMGPMGPTGTRKNITPESLVPYDAPIQARKYKTPSQTSRKDLPATFARKRARSQAFGEEEVDVGPSLSEEDAIRTKRLQNTLAARRSRKRKLEYQRELEEAVEAERKEKDMWKARALVLEALLRDKGHDIPRIEDV